MFLQQLILPSSVREKEKQFSIYPTTFTNSTLRFLRSIKTSSAGDEKTKEKHKRYELN